MNKKRFEWKKELKYVDEFVYDNKTDKKLDEEDMYELLNALYEENRELTRMIVDVLYQVKFEQSYSTPVCSATVLISPKMYQKLSKKFKKETWWKDD